MKIKDNFSLKKLGAVLHEGVEGRDVRRTRVPRRRGPEQQPELGAGGEARRLQRPVEGNRIGAVGLGRGAFDRLRLGPGRQGGQQRQGEQRGGEDRAQGARQARGGMADARSGAGGGKIEAVGRRRVPLG